MPATYPWQMIPNVQETSVSGQGGLRLNLARIRGDGVPAKALPVLFVHGVLRHWRTFYPLIEQLSAERPLLGLDQRGHGHSAHDTNGQYRVMDYVADMESVLRQAAEPQLILYGHSLGAMVVLAAAAKVPDKVAGLILEDPPFGTMGERLAQLPLRNFFIGVQNLLAQPDTRTAETIFPKFSEMVVGRDESGNAIRVKDQRDELSRRFSSESFSQLDPRVLESITAGEWLDGYDLASVLEGVRCPVALLQADETCGGMLIDQDADVVCAQLGTACQRIRFPGCGHQIHSTRTEDVVKVIRGMCET